MRRYKKVYAIGLKSCKENRTTLFEIHPLRPFVLQSARFTQVPHFHFPCHLHISASPVQLWTQRCGNRPHASRDEMLYFSFSTSHVKSVIGPVIGCPTPPPQPDTQAPQVDGRTHPPTTPLQGVPLFSSATQWHRRLRITLQLHESIASKNNFMCVTAQLIIFPARLQ